MKSHGHKGVFGVYDISSSSVAGGHVLAKHDPTAKTLFLASARNDAALQENIDINRFVDETVKNLDAVIARVRKADVHHPSFIQVVLASPWYSSQTRTIVYKKETPFIATKKLIESLVDAEVQDIFTKEESPFGKESVIVEKQLSTIKLNGYITDDPYGKKALSIEIALTITFAPKPVLDRFSDTIRRAYGTRNIGFTTSPFTTFIVMREMLPIQEECIVIDIGEEVTDIAFVKAGALLYQHSFPIGTYGLYRALAQQGTHTPQESIALLESYRLGKLSPEAVTTAEKAITAFSTLWQAGFQKVLENGQYGFCMPENVIMTADPRFQSLFTTVIVNDPFVKHSCARGAPIVTFMNESTLEALVGTVDATPIDVPLATGALFVERLL